MSSVIVKSIASTWDDGTGVVASISSSWDDGTTIVSTGSPFTKPSAPGGSTPTAPTLDPDHVLDVPTGVSNVVHTVTVTDLRDDAVLEFFTLTLSTDASSVVWSLNATVPNTLFARFTDDGDMPVISAVIDGIEWQFLIEDIRSSREFGSATLTLTGRSLTITAGEPYQFPVNWVNDGPTSAAQLVTQAQAFTAMDVDWLVDDWVVPDRVWSFSGTPLAVAKRVAESVGAVVVSDRKDFRIAVKPRYRVLPNEWPTVPPDVAIHLAAVRVLSYERADEPAYDGVYVSGQQQGVVGHVYLAGTAGDHLAPLVTDLLLTDLDAVAQRGVAILGASGAQARVTMELPVLTGTGEPGVFELGWICSVIGDEVAPWWGMVRGVSVNVGMPSITQTVVFERHTRAIPGTVVTEAP